jgi:hypothetical protein
MLLPHMQSLRFGALPIGVQGSVVQGSQSSKAVQGSAMLLKLQNWFTGQIAVSQVHLAVLAVPAQSSAA